MLLPSCPGATRGGSLRCFPVLANCDSPLYGSVTPIRTQVVVLTKVNRIHLVNHQPLTLHLGLLLRAVADRRFFMNHPLTRCAVSRSVPSSAVRVLTIRTSAAFSSAEYRRPVSPFCQWLHTRFQSPESPINPGRFEETSDKGCRRAPLVRQVCIGKASEQLSAH